MNLVASKIKCDFASLYFSFPHGKRTFLGEKCVFQAEKCTFPVREMKKLTKEINFCSAVWKQKQD